MIKKSFPPHEAPKIPRHQNILHLSHIISNRLFLQSPPPPTATKAGIGFCTFSHLSVSTIPRPLCVPLFYGPKRKRNPPFFPLPTKEEEGLTTHSYVGGKDQERIVFCAADFFPSIPQFRIIRARSPIPLSPSSPNSFVILLPSIKRKPVASRRRWNNKPHCLCRALCVDPPSRE